MSESRACPLPGRKAVGRKAVDYKIRIVRVTRTQGFGSSDPHSVGLAERSQTSLCRLREVGGACSMAKSYRGLDRHQREDQETRGQRHHSYTSRGVSDACPCGQKRVVMVKRGSRDTLPHL
eukprot:scaffold5711_cov115-Skeletonema_marinoi.AAC.1